MTAMTKVNGLALTALTVGQVAEQFDVTVRTLHHYDEIGLLVPSERTSAGYRLYDGKDITRLQQVVVYRRLGFALEEIAVLLEEQGVADGDAVIGHLRRQRDAVMSRLDEMQALVTAIDRALEKEVPGIKLTKQEQKELFGDGFFEEYADEAEQQWGETETWKQSKRRTSKYPKQDWVQIKAETEAAGAAFAAAMDAGLPATSEEATDAAEQSRLHIEKWFYDTTPEFHRNLGDMYIADPRFTKTYEDIRPGMAQYIRDAIHANSDRAARAAGEQS
jgi:MerR family transcriptional regulator, thiopeptide resistance regulator